MKKTGVTITGLVVLIALCVNINSCRKSDARKGPSSLTFNIPAGFPAPAYDFTSNPLTQEGFNLGKKLFYDGRLSKDGNFPCGSCHQQFAAFATFDHDLSHGFNDQFTTRNAPGLYNLAWHKAMHWDGGINHIENQPLAPITAPNEMAEDITNVISKLKADEEYKRMFVAAFGDDEINSQRMLKSLTQFMLMLVSADSKYDRVKKGTATFTAAEQSGYVIFQSKCASCHKEPLFTDLSYRNNGLVISNFLQDFGRMRITNKKEDSLKFKVPSLRNIELTFPYMHDGRFYTIDQVLNHYATGVQNSATLDPLLQNRIALSTTERLNMRAFLKTLTDSSFVKDSRFAE
ncbi:MAG: cytochrome-c peroxidase [Gemmatimonadaceae bacterium]|nr:cytochrome-c peroxidase [Chitinophagaceae bacterium]